MNMEFIRPYINRGIVLDTNLLILYIIGRFKKDLIGNFKRVAKYTPEDYDILFKFLAFFKKKITSPHILTEATNLLEGLNKTMNYQLFNFLRKLIDELEEFIIDSQIVVKTNCFLKFGLTDAAISIIGNKKYLILTDDFNLYNFLIRQKVPAINFNHIRTIAWNL